MTKAKKTEPRYPALVEFYTAHPGPYASIQSAADAYYGQATTEDQLTAVGESLLDAGIELPESVA